MKKISTSFLILSSVFIFFSFAFPLNKVNAAVTQNFTNVPCGYDQSSFTEILCNFTLKITNNNPLIVNENINAEFYMGSSTGNKIGAPSLVRFHDNYNNTSYNSDCGVGNNNCTSAHTTNTTAPNKAGSSNNLHNFDFFFRWDTAYGKYEYNKSLEYKVGNGPSYGDQKSYVTIGASDINIESGGSTTINWAGMVDGISISNDCHLDKVDMSGVVISSFISPVISGLEETTRYGVNCGGGYSMNTVNSKFANLPNLFKKLLDVILPNTAYAVPDGPWNSIIIHVVDLPENVSVQLAKNEGNYKNLVAKQNPNNIGRAYLKASISGLTGTGKKCELKNSSVSLNPKKEWTNDTSAGGDYFDFTNLPNNTNNFQIFCNDSGNKTSNVQSFAGQSGTLTVPTECTIPVGGSGCTNVSVTWNTVNPQATTTTSVYLDDVSILTGNGGDQHIAISGEGIPNGGTQRTAILKTKNKVDGEGGTLAIPATPVVNELASKTIAVKCAVGSSWNTTTNKCVENTTLPTLTNVTIGGTPQVGQTLTAAVTPVSCLANYQWKSSATSNGTYTNIAGAGLSTYTLQATELGKYIKVQATGAINCTDSVTSTAVGPVTASTFALTVTKNVATGGTISSSPAGINCDTTCTAQSASFNSGTSVTLTALPSGNYKFTGWSGGGCSGTALTCSVSMTEARNVNAFFSSGTISLSSDACIIAYGADTCNAYVTWSTQDRVPSALTAVTRNNPDNISVSTAPSGKNVANAVRNGVSTYFLYHNSVLLNQVSITATKTYAVIFNSNGGTGTMANQEIVSGQTENLDGNQFTRTGYTFKNWATRADGGGTNYLDGASYTMGTADVTLYAQWTGLPPTPTGLTATPSTCGNNWINLSWNISAGATSYQFYRDGSGPIEATTLALYGCDATSCFGSDTGLTLGSTHTYRVRATNTEGSSSQSNLVSAIVASACTPTLTTANVTSITKNSARSGGNISSDGGSAVTARGVVWSTSANPTIALTTKTNNGTGIGEFSSDITGLTEATFYHVRAYATNSIGTSYGEDILFSTQYKVVPVNMTPGLGTIDPTSIQYVDYMGNTNFTITPNAEYHTSIEGTCPLGGWSGNRYTTGSIIANCTIRVRFISSVFTVTPSAGANGSISPDTQQFIAPNLKLSFIVTPSAGYTSSIGGTCPEGTWVGDKYTTGAITANCTVEASFLGMTGTLTPGPNTSCTIANGEDNCKIDLNWTTTNPIGTSAVTSPTGTPNPGNSVNNGTQTFTAPYNAFGVNFFLYNNGQKLAETNVATNCMPGSVWNGTTKVCEVEVLAGQPDLIAGIPYITTKLDLDNMIIYSDIENRGNASTEPIAKVGFRSFIKKLFNIKNVFAGLSEGGGGEVIGSTGFYNLFQTSTDASNPDSPKGVIDYPITPEMAHIVAGGSRTTQSPITEFKNGEWVRFCADKNSAGDIGVITESDEKNNCSDWVEVDKLSPLPPTGDIWGEPDPCVIPLDGNSCLTDVSWTSSNTSGTVTLVSDGKILKTGIAGEISESIPFSSRDFSLKDNEVVLVTKTIGANCVAGTTWTIDKCIKIIIVPPAYNIGLNASKGTIVKGGATVVRWDSVDSWASSCVASSTDNNWTGDKMTSGGSDPLHPLVTTTYTLTCVPTDGSADVIENVTVKVIEPNVKEE